VNSWTSDKASITTENGVMVIEGTEPGVGQMLERMSVSFPIQVPEGDLFIRFMVKADSLRAFSADVPRFFFVTANGLNSTEWNWETLEGMAGSQEFEEMTFYYREAGPANVIVNIEFEGYEKVRIKDMTIHNEPDVMLREFDNGLVLINPSSKRYLFNIPKMFPDQSFRYYQGNVWEEFIGLNNKGQIVQGPVSLNSHRGLFLVKVRSDRTSLQSLDTDNEIKIYPVPATEAFNLEFMSPDNGRSEVFLYRPDGKMVQTWIRNRTEGKNCWKFTQKNLDGLYLLKINTGSRISTKKILFY